ncbi:MAG TPA: sugar porter family MFS transporter, partial [Chlamydiales bacterium]|nr:sugar porter family MFS transporter [Chlamydiales bacterium]
VGALIGAFSGGFFSDRYGRKFTLFITSFLFIVGTFFLSFADGISMLIVGRFFSGLAIGIASVIVPLYISEMSPAEYRGGLVSLNQLAITIGILISLIIDYSFADDAQWRKMFGMSFIPAIAYFFGLIFIPETPSFLASKGKQKKALKILEKIHRRKTFDEVVDEPRRHEADKTSSWGYLFSKAMRPALIVGVGISILQQITGINIVFYYAPRIFQLAGFESASAAILASMGVGIVNVFITIIALWLIDLVGRRPLLIAGVIGMSVSLVLLGGVFLMKNEHLGLVAMIALMLYVAFFAFSLGPIAWLIISEIYPLGIRGRAMGFASFVNWSSNYIVSVTFLSLVHFFGPAGTFWLYAAIGVIGLWFIFKMVPETKGKTLEQIQNYWKKG